MVRQTVKRGEKSDYGDTVDGLKKGRYHSFDPDGENNILATSLILHRLPKFVVVEYYPLPLVSL